MLKIIALIFMIIDHVGYFLPNINIPSLHLLGRISAPIFFFLFTESYRLTSNKRNYFKRLSIYSLIMFTSNLVLCGLYNIFNIENNLTTLLTPNIFLSMTICFLILEVLKKITSSNRITEKCNFLFLFLFLSTILAFTEYNIFALFMTLTFYYLREHILSRNIIFFIGGIVLSLLSNLPIQMAMVLSLIFISEYNGKKGSELKIINKSFFYNFYVIHIFILSIFNILIQVLNK